MKKVLFRLCIVAAVLGGAYGAYKLVQQLPQRQEKVATANVRRSDVIIRSFSRGEMRAVRSVTLTAPNLFGTVQVTKLAPMGSLSREKDLIVEFDDSERRAQLEETLLEVEQIDEQIKKAKADLAIRDNTDEVDLLRSRYGVRRAQLEVKRNELLSAIDAKKNILTLEEEQRRLKQLESDIKSRKEQAQAELAVLAEQRNRAIVELNREKQRIAQAKLLSPMTGLVAIKQNRTGGFFFSGMQIPDIREGDTLQPGVQVADILDLSEMELVAKVGELDRANLREGQDALITLDALPGKQVRGRIKSMSGQASANMWSGDPSKKFDVIFSIDMAALLKELGAKPEDVRRIMETAAANAKKGIPAPPPSPVMMAGPGGPGGPGGAAAAGGPGGAAAAGGPGGAAAAGGPGGAAAAGGPGGAAGAGGPGGGGPQIRIMRPGEGGEGGQGGQGRQGRGGPQMSAEDRDKMRKLIEKETGGKKMEDLSQEERQKIFAKVRAQMGLPARQGGPGGAPGGPMIAGFPGMGGAGMVGGFSEADRERAKLPPPPEEDSQLQVLLRPGLLADIEIIVEKISNALHIPAQAVFEKDGKQIVYVKRGSRFEERPIQLAKRSESTMVLSGGVKEGEVVALADPNVKPGSGKAGERKSPGASPMMPRGGGR